MNDEDLLKNEPEEKAESDEECQNQEIEIKHLEGTKIEIPNDFDIGLPKQVLDLPDFEWDVDFPGDELKKKE